MCSYIALCISYILILPRLYLNKLLSCMSLIKYCLHRYRYNHHSNVESYYCIVRQLIKLCCLVILNIVVSSRTWQTFKVSVHTRKSTCLKHLLKAQAWLYTNMIKMDKNSVYCAVIIWMHGIQTSFIYRHKTTCLKRKDSITNMG